MNKELIFFRVNGKSCNIKEVLLGVDVSVVIPQELEHVNVSRLDSKS